MGEHVVSWCLFDELYHVSVDAIRRIGQLSRMTTNDEALEVMEIVDILIADQKCEMEGIWEKAGGKV